MSKQLKKVLSALLCLAMVFTMIPSSVLEASAQQAVDNNAEANDNGNLLAHYTFDDASVDGTTIKDHSGNGNDATVQGAGATFSDGAIFLPGGGAGSTAAYIELPKGMFDGQDELTINIWLKNETGSGNYAAMSFGTPTKHFGGGSSNVPTSYWLLNPANPSGYFKSVWTNSTSESSPWSTETATSTTKTGSDWALYTTVITSTSITGYINGTQVITASKTRTTTDFGTGLVAAIGRSGYNDIFYKGGVRDVKVYNTAVEVSQIQADYNETVLSIAKAGVDLGDISNVKTDITLPTSSSFDTVVTWESDNKAVITNDGKVTRPSEDTQVTLTATITYGDASTTKDFAVTVAKLTPQIMFEEALDELQVSTSGVEDTIALPTTLSADNTRIVWESSDSDTVSTDGVVTRPAKGEADKTVTLTAKASYDDETNKYEDVKEFTVVIRAEAYGTILAYTNSSESSVLGNSLHLAYSADGKNYTALNNNTGICFAKNIGGTKNVNPNSLGLPVIFRKADGTYGMIARNASTSSKYLYVYDSEDLINFTNERQLAVPETVGKVGLECQYNAEEGVYEIYWAKSSTAVYKTTTKDLETALSTEQVTDKTFSKVTFDADAEKPAGVVANCVFELSKDEYDRVVNKLDVVKNTGFEEISVTAKDKAAVAGALPDKVKALYSDGSTADFKVTWDLNSADLTKAGTHTVTGTLKQTIYANPFIEQRADPCILKGEDGYYYFTASYPMCGYGDQNGYDKVVLRRSATIEGLATAKEVTIFDCDDVSGENRYVWAPEIRIVDGNYYVFYTSSIGSSVWSIRPHVLKCTDPDNIMDPSSWQTMGVMQAAAGDTTAFTDFSLDMTVFENNGRYYVIWAQTDGFSSLFIAEVDKDEPWKCISKSTKISFPEYSWERIVENVDEGPSIIKNNGKIYCAFSAAGTGVEYCIGLLTADENADLLDANSWVKQGYPVLGSSDVEGEYGPGHNSFTVDEDGNPIFVYHARGQECYDDSCAWASQSSLYDPCRDARLKRVHWAADGTPILKMQYEDELITTTVTATVTVEKSTAAPVTPIKPADKPANVGTTQSVGNASYQVTSSDAKNPTVAYKKNTDTKAKSVTVPATVKIGNVTYTVTSIAKDAFKSNKKLTSVKINAAITDIGANAFSGCTALKSVVIPEGVKTIGSNAFKGDKNLKKITIKSTVLKKVGKSAFKGINSKATIKVPKKQKKTYQKLLKKKGQASTVKIK